MRLSINIESQQNIPTFYDHLFDVDWDQVAISDDTPLYQSWNGIFHRDRNIKIASMLKTKPTKDRLIKSKHNIRHLF